MKNCLFYPLCALCALAGFSAQAQPELVRAESLCTTGEDRFENGQYQQAIDTLQKAIDLFEKLNNTPALVRSLNLQAESFSNLNQCDKARQILNRSLKLATTKLPVDHPELAQTYYYLSRATGICARKIDDAIRLVRQSMRIKQKLYGPESLEISYDYTAMGYYYDNKELPDTALQYLHKALAIRQKKLPADDIEIAYTLHVMAQVYENQSELTKSLERHLRALKIRQTKLVENHPLTLHSINAIGSVYRKLGNFDRALDYYRYALENRKKALGEDHSDVSCSYYSIANLCKDIYDYHTAIQYYLQGHRILEKLYGINTDVLPAYYAVTAKMYGMVGEHEKALEYIGKAELVADENISNDHPFRGIAYNYIGDYYAEINDLPRQTSYFERAISIFRKAYGDGSVREGDILFRMGSVSAKNKRFAEAINYYKKTLTIYEAKMGKRNPKVAAVLHAIGNVHNELGQFDEALKMFRSSFAAISTSFDDVDEFANPAAEDLEGKFLAIQIAGSKGTALYKQALTRNDLTLHEKSLATFEFGIQLIDLLLTEYNNDNAKIELEKESRKIYARALESAFTLYQLTRDKNFMNQAFAISEKSRAPLLLQNIRDGKAKTLAGVPDNLLAQERDIKIELAFYKNALYQARREKKAAKVKTCENNIFLAQQKYDSLKQRLEQEFPKYYDLKYNIRTTGVADLQHMLPDENTLAVEFFSDDSALYVFSVTKNNVRFESKPIRASFWALLSDYERSLSQSHFILNSREEADRLYVRSAQALYDILLASAVNSAGNGTKKLIIIPDDRLAQLNFGTLITAKPEGRSIDYTSLDYLFKKHRISYAYSSAFIKNDPARVRQPKFGFAGFAPSYSGNQFTAVDTMLHPMAYRIYRDGTLPLPGAEEEVKYLSDLMSGRSWLNAEATETNFKQHAADYNILHLAMHSLLNNENPEYSELLFNREKDERNDGYLKVAEIYNLHLNAELVVLSACSSGYGKIQKGEGPISISRAFSYAGCPSVVMSLWKVPDEVTRQIMTYFYRELQNGAEKDEALRMAQLQFVNTTHDPVYRHPHYWAGFVVMGDTAAFPASWPMGVLIAIVLLGCIVFVVLKMKRGYGRVS